MLHSMFADKIRRAPPWLQSHPDADSTRQSSLLTAIFHTWNATIGVGILAMPRAFALVGWAPGSVMLFVFGM